MKEAANNFTHIEATFVDVCRGKQRDGIVSFQRPALYHFRTRSNATSEYKPNLLIFVAPIQPGKCRVMIPDFKVPGLPTWLGHAGSNRFLNSDTWLHDAERIARIDLHQTNKLGSSMAVGAARSGKEGLYELNYVFASKSDFGPILFRSWWVKQGLADRENFFGKASASSLPVQELSRAEQIDPWVHHSKHCSKCRRALMWMKRLRRISVACAASLAITLRNKPPFAISFILVGLWANNFLQKLTTVIEGNSHRSEIGDRSVSAMK